MDCDKARGMLQKAIDGRLPADLADEVTRHVAACPACAAEEAELRRVGEAMRGLAAGLAREKGAQLDSLWTRVSAGIEEQGGRRASAVRWPRWLWLPMGVALAVLAALLYPSGVSRAPFHPTSFDVSVEDIESDEPVVALVDRGEDLPRVIWIVENGKT